VARHGLGGSVKACIRKIEHVEMALYSPGVALQENIADPGFLGAVLGLAADHRDGNVRSQRRDAAQGDAEIAALDFLRYVHDPLA